MGSNLPLQHQSWPQKNDFEKTEEGASDYCFIQYRNEEVYYTPGIRSMPWGYNVFVFSLCVCVCVCVCVCLSVC